MFFLIVDENDLECGEFIFGFLVFCSSSYTPCWLFLCLLCVYCLCLLHSLFFSFSLSLFLFIKQIQRKFTEYSFSAFSCVSLSFPLFCARARAREKEKKKGRTETFSASFDSFAQIEWEEKTTTIPSLVVQFMTSSFFPPMSFISFKSFSSIPIYCFF